MDRIGKGCPLSPLGGPLMNAAQWVFSRWLAWTTGIIMQLHRYFLVWPRQSRYPHTPLRLLDRSMIDYFLGELFLCLLASPAPLGRKVLSCCLLHSLITCRIRSLSLILYMKVGTFIWDVSSFDLPFCFLSSYWPPLSQSRMQYILWNSPEWITSG